MILGSNMEGYYQQVRGLQYYYITKGHGKQDVIFLHGFLGSHAIFLEGLLETDLIDTHRLILMDLLGQFIQTCTLLEGGLLSLRHVLRV